MNRVFLAVFCLLVGGAIGAGLWVVGGPQKARIEQQDRDRIADLRTLHTRLISMESAGAPLPRTLEDDSVCAAWACEKGGSFPPKDPATGMPYDYRRLSDDRFEICATLAQHPGTARAPVTLSDDMELRAGNVLCLVGTVRPEGS